MNTYNILKLYKNKCPTRAPDILGIRAISKDITMFQLINYKKKKKIAPQSDDPDTKEFHAFKSTKPCLNPK